MSFSLLFIYIYIYHFITWLLFLTDFPIFIVIIWLWCHSPCTFSCYTRFILYYIFRRYRGFLRFFIFRILIELLGLLLYVFFEFNIFYFLIIYWWIWGLHYFRFYLFVFLLIRSFSTYNSLIRKKSWDERHLSWDFSIHSVKLNF